MTDLPTASVVHWSPPGTSSSVVTGPGAVATLRLLATRGLTWRQARTAAMYDPDARTVCTAFIDAGFGDLPVAEHVPPHPKIRLI